MWCLPGGKIEDNESATEACTREIKEETGYDIEVVRLLGLYSKPSQIIEYPDQNVFRIIALNFEGIVISGHGKPNNEVLELGYFSYKELATMPIFDFHIERISDSFVKGTNIVLK